MTNRKTTADYFKTVGVDMTTYKVNPNKKFKKSTTPGLKKGSGGIDGSGLAAGAPGGSGGVGEKSMTLMSAINEAIEDVTDSEDANIIDKNGGDDDIEGQENSADSPDELDLESSGGDVDEFGAGEPVTRFVPGAHLIYKRQSDVDSFEELWIYAVNVKSPTEHAKIEQQILAGTDIDANTMASEDGNQRATPWHAGNAKYLHLTGLVN